MGVAKAMPRKNKVKIYINALTQIAIDPHNRIPTTDARLIRRIVRDSQFRAYSALDTLRIWAAVRHGEEGNIFPYGEQADIMFNSALLYEQAILKKYAIPLLKQVRPDQPEYSEAKRLIRMLSYFMKHPKKKCHSILFCASLSVNLNRNKQKQQPCQRVLSIGCCFMLNAHEISVCEYRDFFTCGCYSCDFQISGADHKINMNE